MAFSTLSNNGRKTRASRGACEIVALSYSCSFSKGHGKSLGQATPPWADMFVPWTAASHGASEDRRSEDRIAMLPTRVDGILPPITLWSRETSPLHLGQK